MDTTRLGRIGVWLGPLARIAWARERDAVQQLEAAGYGAFWPGEGNGTKEIFAHCALLLGATERAVVAPGIANIYARDPLAAASGANTLAEAFPGRFVLGLGVSHKPSVEQRGAVYDRPIAAMRGYLDALDGVPFVSAPPAEAAPVVLAALGPKMLDLARERTFGAHPYFVPPEHTALARERLGAGKLLAPEQAVLLVSDPSEARRQAREHVRVYLQLPNYVNNLRRLGFGDEDVSGDGSDRLVDAIVAWGSHEQVRARVVEHLDAGADHVCVQALGPKALDQLLELAPALLAA
jgi:probable F420-dependent oxidoreductase